VEFKLLSSISEGRWTVQFIVDSAAERRTIVLGSIDNLKYSTGSHSFVFSVGQVDVSSLSRNTLFNIAELVLEFSVSDKTLQMLRLVTQITKGKDGQLLRRVLSPWA